MLSLQVLISRAEIYCEPGSKACPDDSIPNGLTIAAADEPTRQVWLWSASKGELIQKLLPAHPAAVTDVRYSPPLDFLASLCERQLCLWR